jgi:hypothetical protein
MPLYKYREPGGGGGPIDPDLLSALGFIRDKGTIALASEFPTPAAVKLGWQYRITAPVTDNDVTKTNTGDTYGAGDEIYWTGSDWVLVDSPTSGGGTVISPPTVIASSASADVDTHVPAGPTTYEWTVSVKDNVTGAFRSSKVFAQYDGTSVTHTVDENIASGTIIRTINVNLDTGTVELEVVNDGPNPVTVVVGRFPIVVN